MAATAIITMPKINLQMYIFDFQLIPGLITRLMSTVERYSVSMVVSGTIAIGALAHVELQSLPPRMPGLPTCDPTLSIPTQSLSTSQPAVSVPERVQRARLVCPPLC